MGCSGSKSVDAKAAPMSSGIKPAVSKNLITHYKRVGGWEADIKAKVDEEYKDAPDGFDGMMPTVTVGNQESIDFYKGIVEGFYAAET